MNLEILSSNEQRYLKGFLFATIVLFVIISFVLSTPKELYEGMCTIIISRDALITDYFELANYGATFLNSAIVMIFMMIVFHNLKITITGLTIAVFFINAGFSLCGKNIINGLPILLGTLLYSRMQGVSVKRYIYTGLFGTCLAPMVTEMVYLLPYNIWINVIYAVLLGIAIGFILPSLSMHTASMHMGYSLFNVGFSAGIVLFIIVSLLKSFGLVMEASLIWKEGRPFFLIMILYSYFVLTLIYGVWINKGDFGAWKTVLKHPGRAVADFIIMEGVGKTLVNMGITGIFCVTYIILIKGDLSGGVIGAILTVFGFSAFGVHIKNFFPCLLGVFIAANLKIFTPTTPSIQMAAIFSATLAPITGQFGVLAGIMAGILHASVVTATNQMYNGLNLYNNGFSGGFVAIIMIPFLESFIKKFEISNRRREDVARRKENN